MPNGASVADAEAVPVHIPLDPLIHVRVPLSARPTAAPSGRFLERFGANPLTGPARRRQKIALRKPILCGLNDLTDLVTTSKEGVGYRAMNRNRWIS